MHHQLSAQPSHMNRGCRSPCARPASPHRAQGPAARARATRHAGQPKVPNLQQGGRWTGSEGAQPLHAHTLAWATPTVDRRGQRGKGCRACFGAHLGLEAARVTPLSVPGPGQQHIAWGEVACALGNRGPVGMQLGPGLAREGGCGCAALGHGAAVTSAGSCQPVMRPRRRPRGGATAVVACAWGGLEPWPPPTHRGSRPRSAGTALLLPPPAQRDRARQLGRW